MRLRLLGLLSDLVVYSGEVPMLRHIQSQRGIFSMLPLTAEQTEILGRDHAIHMPQYGRINIAGLKKGDPARFADGFSAVTAVRPAPRRGSLLTTAARRLGKRWGRMGITRGAPTHEKQKK